MRNLIHAVKIHQSFQVRHFPINFATRDKSDAKTLDKAVTTATYKYNKGLKLIGELAGITKPISSHYCRISYVSISAQGGVPLTTIQNVVKHSKLEMTAHYSKFTDSQGDKALLTLEHILLNQ